MLDQNTDRMWYVIGAIVIGAAIIAMGLNIYSDSFNSVEDNFAELALNVDILSIGRVNLLNHTDVKIEGGMSYSESHVIEGLDFPKPWGAEFLRHVDLAPIFEDEYGGLLDATYTLSFDLKSKDIGRNDKMYVYMQSNDGTKYSFIARHVKVSEEYQNYIITGLRPSIHQGNQDRVNPYTTSHLAFYGEYGTGNVPVVRNLRLYRE